MTTFFQNEAINLYEIAKHKGIIETIFSDFQLFKNGVGGQMPFSQMMTNESISHQDKAKLIETLNPFFSEDTQQFFNAFVQEKHFDVIYHGVEYFEWLYYEHHVTVTSAVELTSDQLKRLLTKVAFKSNKTIDTYDTVIDDTVIGGVKVESSTFLVDSTVKAQLESLAQQM